MNMDLQIMFIKFIIRIGVIAFECARGQTIELYEYNQEESVTNCTHGVISDVDTVVFKAKIDYPDDINTRRVYFQIKEKEESIFWTFNVIDLKNCVIADSYICEHMDTYVVLITITMKAAKKLSSAKIKGVVLTSNRTKITSVEQIFPEIADATDMTGTLLINGVTIPETNNSYFAKTNGTVTDFRFECASTVFPCLIQISEPTLMKPIEVQNSINCIFQQKQLNIILKKALCTIDSKNVIFEIVINGSQSDSDYISEANEERTTFIPVFWILSVLSITHIVILLIVITIRAKITSKILYFKNNKKFTDISMNLTEEHTESTYRESMLNDGNSTSLETGINRDQVNAGNKARKKMHVTVDIHTTTKSKENTNVKDKEATHTSHYVKEYDDINIEKSPTQQCMHTKEMKGLLGEGKERFQENRNSISSLKTKEPRLNFDNSENKLFYLTEVLKVGNNFENKSLEMFPMPDDDFPFSEPPTRLNFKISNNIYLNAKLCTYNDTNEKCTCHTCRGTHNSSSEWVKLSLIKHSFDTDVTVDLNNVQDINNGIIDSKGTLQRDLNEKVKVIECVTCDKDVTDRFRQDQQDMLHQWRNVKGKKEGAYPLKMECV